VAGRVSQLLGKNLAAQGNTLRANGRVIGQLAGKTHLVRWAREQVQLRHGYFFLMGIADGRSFWTNIVHAFLRGLRRSGSYRHLQLSVFLGALAEIAQVTNATRLMARGDRPITPEALDQL